MTTTATPPALSLAEEESYHKAMARFSQQTEELKKFLTSEDDDEGGFATQSESSFEDEVEGGSSAEEQEEGSDSENESDSDDEDSDFDSDLEELEAVLIGAKAAPAGTTSSSLTHSSPALLAMNVDMEEAGDNVLPGILNLKERMRRCADNSYLQAPVQETVPETLENPFASTSPEDHLRSLLEGFSAASFPSNTWHDYFLTMTDEHIDAYTHEVERAIRDENYPVLRDMIEKGQTLQCSNKHGESIVHIACRRGSLQLVQFLIHEAGVSTRIRDDVGRTPLHDTCWTHKPDFDIVRELLSESPELLFIVDHRGFTPLHYVPKEAWGVWCEWLQEHRQMLRDMVKSLRFDRARYFIKTMVPCLKF